MPEEYLHYLWEKQLFSLLNLRTTAGEPLRVLNRGEHNSYAGPDFQHGKIVLGQITLVGHIEIHVKSSFWNGHHHQNDPAYNTVILHVVWEDNAIVRTNSGHLLPTLVLKPYVNVKSLEFWHLQKKKGSWVPCSTVSPFTNDKLLERWKENQLHARLNRRGINLENYYKQRFYKVADVLIYSFVSAFGFKGNKEAFQLLMDRISLVILLKESASQLNREALLFGVAGLLPAKASPDLWVAQLQVRFSILRKQYSLVPIPKIVWRFGGLRPANSPIRRIAQLAASLQHLSTIMIAAKQSIDLSLWREILQVSVSEYWVDHSSFETKSKKPLKRMGKLSQESILINAVLPYYHWLGRKNKNVNQQRAAVLAFHDLKGEENNVISKWLVYGVKSRSAFDSQALLEWRLACKSHKKCLDCPIGKTLLSSN